MSNSYLLYTAIFDSYDSLREIPRSHYEPELFDYVCFSDQDLRSKTFQVQRVRCCGTPPMMNRFYKTMIDVITREKYKASIYLDGNVRVKGKLSGLFDANEDLTVHDHVRTCVYEEAEAIIQKKKDSRSAVDKWVQRLEREEYPRDNGLYWNGVLVRKHSDRMRAMSQEWWEMLNEYSYRDQLTLPYLVKKHPISVRCLHRKLDKRGVFDGPIFYYDGRHKDDARSFEWLSAFFPRKLRGRK